MEIGKPLIANSVNAWMQAILTNVFRDLFNYVICGLSLMIPTLLLNAFSLF